MDGKYTTHKKARLSIRYETSQLYHKYIKIKYIVFITIIHIEESHLRQYKTYEPLYIYRRDDPATNSDINRYQTSYTGGLSVAGHHRPSRTDGDQHLSERT